MSRTATGPVSPSALVAVLAFLLSTGTLYGVVELEVEPAWPFSNDPLTITVAYRDYPLCFEPFLLVQEDRISVEIPCDGPIHLEGEIEDGGKSATIVRTFETDPLPSGVYAVEVATNMPIGPLNERRVVASRPLTVHDSDIDIRAVALDPPAPFAGDPVTLEFTTGCGTVLGTPAIAGRSVVVRGHFESPNPPCFGMPIVQRVPVGPLPAGEHSLLVLDDGRGLEPAGQLYLLYDFRVAPIFTTDVVLDTAGGRFTVAARWTRRNGASGPARGVPLADPGGSGDSATFYFFRPGNRELMAKVLDGCRANGFYWVFLGGLTDLGVMTTVTDTVGAREKVYTNPLGRPFAPVLDTRAFACD